MIENVVPPRAKGPYLHKHDFDVPHTRTNRTEEPARYVLVCTPAGLERQFARMAAEQAGEEPPEWALQPIPEVTQVGAQIDG